MSSSSPRSSSRSPLPLHLDTFAATPTPSFGTILQDDARDNGDTTPERQASEEARPRGDYDRDLIEQLPSVQVLDGLVTHYFAHATALHRHVHEPAFLKSWEAYKAGESPDKLALATACAITSVAAYFLPATHELRTSLGPPPPSVTEGADELDAHAEQLYNVSMQALERHQSGTKKYSLELIELHLVRCHYLTLARKDSEEIWSIKGDLVTTATAMGLHRDPGQWKMNKTVAERRRWAWWHILLLERSVILRI